MRLFIPLSRVSIKCEVDSISLAQSLGGTGTERSWLCPQQQELLSACSVMLVGISWYICTEPSKLFFPVSLQSLRR